MYFSESDSLASEQPLLAGLIGRVDALLRASDEDALLEPDVVASSLEDSRARVESVLDGLCMHSLLERSSWRECACGALSSSDLLRCEVCGRSLKTAEELTGYRFSARTKAAIAAERAAAKLATPGDVSIERVLQFMGGDRGGTQRQQLQIHREFKLIGDAIARGTYPSKGRFTFPQAILSASPTEVGAAYKTKPDVLHFAGHGEDRRLTFLRDNGALVEEEPLDAVQLATVLGTFQPVPVLCLLNACLSATIADELVQRAVSVVAIGWEHRVSDGVASAFASAFYEHVARGQTVGASFTLARTTCGAQSVGAEVRLYSAANVDPEKFNL